MIYSDKNALITLKKIECSESVKYLIEVLALNEVHLVDVTEIFGEQMQEIEKLRKENRKFNIQ